MRASPLRGFAVLIIPLAACVSMRAITIAEHVGGTVYQASADHRAQSFTTTSTEGHAFNSITFNFFTDAFGGATKPFAMESGALFSVPLAGPTDAHSPSPSSGYLGRGTAVGGFYIFDPSMTLLGGTKYYFYAGVIAFVYAGGVYSGGNGYIVSGANGYLPFQVSSGSFNFRVTGSPVPDGVSTLMIFALAGMILLRIHRRSIRNLPAR